MSEPLEETYFNWLYSKVASIDVASTPSITYYKLFRALHKTEYAWLVSGDDNRAAEGVYLRNDFLRESQLGGDALWPYVPCSVLEMLIALAQGASENTDFSTRTWFWIMLENLGLNHMSDNHLGVRAVVEEVLDTFIWRTYDEYGRGGLFPLDDTERDQREVEVWYQFSEYVIENDIV